MSESSDHQPMSGRASIHNVERCKLLANGLQLVAVCILFATIVAPLFNPAPANSLWSYVCMGGLASLFEIAAMHVIGYVKP